MCIYVPMTGITKNRIAELKVAGYYEDFLAFVDLKQAEGLSIIEAESVAYDRFKKQLKLSGKKVTEWDVLLGKTASHSEILKWVARNMEIRPSMADCPDPTAWNLLETCRSNPSFKVDFWKSLWSKLIPTKTQLNDDDDEEPDGTLQVAMIEKIQSIRRKIEKEAEN